MKRLLLILILLSGLVANAQDQPGITVITRDSLPMNLMEQWRYHEGNDTVWAKPEFDDSEWHPVRSLLIKSENPGIDFRGRGWMRLHVFIDSTLAGEPLSMSIRQAGACYIYFDGELIKKYGSIGDDGEGSEYFNPQGEPFIFVPDSTGHHVIAVHYAYYKAQELYQKFDDPSVGFLIDLDVANHAVSQYIGQNMALSVLCMLLVGFFLALAVVHFLLWLFRRSEKSNLYYSIFGMSLSLFIVTGYLSVTVSNSQFTIWASYGSVIFASTFMLSLTGITNVLFSKSRIRFYIMALFCITPALVSWFSVTSAARLIVFPLLIITIEAIILTIRAIYKKQRGARIVGAGVLFFALFVLSVLLIAIFSGSFYIDGTTTGGIMALILTMAAILSIPVSMSVYLAWNFADMTRNLDKQLDEVQRLNEKTLLQEQEKKKMLETENERLEHEVAARTTEIIAEKQKSDELLLNILPEEIAEELKAKGSSDARHYDHVSVIFTDFVGFTKAGERMAPQELVNELDTCFKAFDQIMSKYHIEKIKTIGDAYLAVCGLPEKQDSHAVNTVHAALDIMAYMQERKQQYPGKTFDIRIGVNSGAVVAGIVGVKKFAYDIWGDTVNTAARMESSSEPNKINISQATYELVKDQFECTHRGEVAAKNKGELDMYFVVSRKS